MDALAALHSPAASSLTRDAAERTGIKVLEFVGRDEFRTRRFLTASGLRPETLRQAAASPVFLLGVLDYLANDEGLLRAFCVEDQTHPGTVMAARQTLAPALPSRPRCPPSSSIVIQCERCSSTSIRRRSELSHAPPTATKLRMPRCGKCGGGFDQVETWLDRRGNEVE